MISELYHPGMLTVGIVGIVAVVVLEWNLISNKKFDKEMEKKRKDEFNKLLNKPVTYSANNVIHSHEFGFFEGCVSENVISIRLNGNSQHFHVQKGDMISLNRKRIQIDGINLKENTISLIFK